MDITEGNEQARIAGLVLDMTQDFMKELITDAVRCCESENRTVVTATDVVRAVRIYDLRRIIARRIIRSMQAQMPDAN